MEINKEWSKPVAIKYGKNIILRFSKEYCLVTVRITGKDSEELQRTILGPAECTIEARTIEHIKSPALMIKSEGPERMTVRIELKDS